MNPINPINPINPNLQLRDHKEPFVQEEPCFTNLSTATLPGTLSLLLVHGVGMCVGFRV